MNGSPSLRKSSLYSLFLIALLGTEFFYIDAFGGVLRIYHFLMPVVILSLYRYIPRLGRSSVFWILLAFLGANVLSALFAKQPGQAFTSLGLLVANMGLAMAVALLLVSGRVDLRTLVNIVLGVAIFAIFLGVLQVAAYRLGGLNLALSKSQEAQLAGGFASGLRTEANGFAKSLNVVFLLVLPSLLASPKWKKTLFITAILVLGMLTSLTRSALYGLAVTLVLSYLWYQVSGRGRLIAPRAMLIFGLATLGLLVFSMVVGGFNEYAGHKLTSFFDSKEILTGDSAGFRLMSQGLLWDAFFASDKTLLLGNGWGQVKFFFADRVMQAGGGELITTLAYGGLLSGIFYLLYQIFSINAARRMVAVNSLSADLKKYEGVMFALINLLITGQINGAIIAPEYWMMYGIAIYCGYAARFNRPCDNESMKLRGVRVQ